MRYLNSTEQRGAALIASLMLLVVMMLIGATAVGISGMENTMAGNMKDKTIALQAAEEALRDGEQSLFDMTKRPKTVSSCGTPPCEVWSLKTLGDVLAKDTAWWQANGMIYPQVIAHVDTQPYRVIEYRSNKRDSLVRGRSTAGTVRWFYTVTARGTGSSDSGESLLQSLYSTRFNL